MENNKTFKTSDIKTSSFLLSVGVELLKVIKDEPQKVIFCFADSNEVKEYLNSYWQGKALVNPRTLFEKLNYLKDLIHRDYEI